MNITREAIENVILEEAGWYGDGYDAVSALLGHDLAELCRLGKAVLGCEVHYSPELGRQVVVHGDPPGWCRNAHGLLAGLLKEAGVERPS